MKVLRRILAISRKELLSLFNIPVNRALILVPPVVLLFLFAWAATREVKNVDFAVMSHDSGIWDNTLVSKLLGSPTFRSVRYTHSPEEAELWIEHQKVLFVLSFQEDFSRKIERMQPASFQIMLDGRRSNAALIAQGYVQQIVSTLGEETPAYMAQSPASIELEAVNWFNPNLEFKWFYLPGLIGTISMMMGFIVSGLSVAREKELGTFDQMLVSPAEPTEIAIAKLIPGCIVAVGQGTVFLLGAHFYFHVPIVGSLFILYAGMVVFAIAVSGVGLLLSSLVSTQQQAFLSCFAVGVPLILLSGFATPSYNMPVLLQYLGELDPLKHFLILIQGVFLKDISLYQSMINILKMCAIAAVTTVVAVQMFKRRV